MLEKRYVWVVFIFFLTEKMRKHIEINHKMRRWCFFLFVCFFNLLTRLCLHKVWLTSGHVQSNLNFICYCYQIWTGIRLIFFPHLIFLVHPSIFPCETTWRKEKTSRRGEEILISVCSNFNISVLVAVAISLAAEVKNVMLPLQRPRVQEKHVI